MYSRYSNRPDQKLQVPENYSGYAFAAAPRREAAPRQLDIAKPTPPIAQQDAPEEPAFPSKEAQQASCKGQETAGNTPHATDGKPQETPSSALCAVPAPPPVKKKTLWGRGIDFDELLLIGLILLLRESEQGSDMVLWLALLLFMG